MARPAPAGPLTRPVAVSMWVMPWSCTLAIGPYLLADDSKFMPRRMTTSFLNGSSGSRIGDSVNSVSGVIGTVVGRQFSGIVPHGLKKTPKRLGGVTADWARMPRGRISSSQGSATPTPSAPRSNARRDSVRGIWWRAGAAGFVFFIAMEPPPPARGTGTCRWRPSPSRDR